MNARWQIDRLPAPCAAGQDGSLPIVDAEDGPTGRVVGVIPGHLEWQATPDRLVRPLDEEDVENARLHAAPGPSSPIERLRADRRSRIAGPSS